MKPILLISFSIVLLANSCKQVEKKLVRTGDYDLYLQSHHLQNARVNNSAEIKFWAARTVKDSNNYVYKLELANKLLQKFRLQGTVEDLLKAEELLKASSALLSHKEADILFTLSQVAIARHEFRSAQNYNRMAMEAGADPYIIRLLEFDTEMELGNHTTALRALNALSDKNAFDYLIRRSKWEDHQGNLDAAIGFMEKAFEKIKENKRSLSCWALSNLADMYGHAGRIKDAYTSYLKVLEKDPGNLYCLKGIAWIAYAHDGNTQEAKNILQYILSQNKMPELKLMLAEIAEAEHEPKEKEKWLNDFLLESQDSRYGAMYNKYLIQLYNDEMKQPAKALSIAETELKNRFTPETCDWMAWSYFRNGNHQMAYEYANGYVFNRNFEPDAIMHTALIFSAMGKKAEATEMLQECLKSRFELGPVATAEIEKMLEKL